MDGSTGIAYVWRGQNYSKLDIQHLAWFIAGFTTTISVTLSMLLISDHIGHLRNPELQVHVIRIAWMVPVYALDACFGLVSTKYAWFWGSARDMYEAFTIYSFLRLLYAMLDGEQNVIRILRRRPEMRPPWPLSCCWDGMQMGEVFHYRCKAGVLQYVLVKPIVLLIELLTHALGVYGGNGRFELNEAYIYTSIVTTTSQMIALCALINFYIHMQEELRPWNPLPKFACIKLVVFFTYWQGSLPSAVCS